ncbi:MAG: MBL fold metallo-hydrolase [Brevundimonas sp.]|nr:MBL fold metallo-hydrolase [Brevundimonas sp.]
MTFHARLAAASLILAAMGAACSQEPETRTAPEATGPAAAVPDDIHAFRIGEIEAVALKDGELALPAADGEASPWNADEAVAVLTGAGRTDGIIHLSIQPLLLRTGDRVVLIDTGAGGQMGTENRLGASLSAAGVQPAQITDVLISHSHADHIGGLAGAEGGLAFPNAVIRMSAAEWADLQANPGSLGPLIEAMKPRVRTFEPGAEVAPGVTAVDLAGHTPGHTGYEIVSDGERLLYIGDAMHSSLISVQRPELVNGWDSDSAAAIRTRQGLLERGASGDLRVYGVHFPFPGLGRFQRRDDGFLWAAEGVEQAAP